MILPGKISVSRSTGPAGDSVRIEIMDERSRASFVVARLSMEEYGNLVSGLSYRPCELDVGALAVVGMYRESKEVEIDFIGYRSGESHGELMERAAETLKAFEVDGWRGRPSDLVNRHNLVAGAVNRYRVHFERHVAGPPEGVAP